MNFSQRISYYLQKISSLEKKAAPTLMTPAAEQIYTYLKENPDSDIVDALQSYIMLYTDNPEYLEKQPEVIQLAKELRLDLVGFGDALMAAWEELAYEEPEIEEESEIEKPTKNPTETVEISHEEVIERIINVLKEDFDLEIPEDALNFWAREPQAYEQEDWVKDLVQRSNLTVETFVNNFVESYRKFKEISPGESKKEIPEESEKETPEMADLIQAGDIIVSSGRASTTLLQRRMSIDYTKASKLCKQLEEIGLVGPFKSNGPRELLMTFEQWESWKKNPVVPEGLLEKPTEEKPTEEKPTEEKPTEEAPEEALVSEEAEILDLEEEGEESLKEEEGISKKKHLERVDFMTLEDMFNAMLQLVADTPDLDFNTPQLKSIMEDFSAAFDKYYLSERFKKKKPKKVLQEVSDWFKNIGKKPNWGAKGKEIADKLKDILNEKSHFLKKFRENGLTHLKIARIIQQFLIKQADAHYQQQINKILYRYAQSTLVQ